MPGLIKADSSIASAGDKGESKEYGPGPFRVFRRHAWSAVGGLCTTKILVAQPVEQELSLVDGNVSGDVQTTLKNGSGVIMSHLARCPRDF